MQGSRFKVQDSGFRVQGSGFRVQGSGFRVQGSGLRVQGSGFRVQGLKKVHRSFPALAFEGDSLPSLPLMFLVRRRALLKKATAG